MIHKNYSSRQKTNNIFTQTRDNQKEFDRYQQKTPLKQQKMRLVPLESQQQNSLVRYSFNRNNSSAQKSLSTNATHLSRISRKGENSFESTQNNEHFIKYRIKRITNIPSKRQQKSRIGYQNKAQNTDFGEKQVSIPIWQNQDVSINMHKKLYKITRRTKTYDHYMDDDNPQNHYLPIIDRARFINLSDTNKKYSNGYLQLFNRKPEIYKKQIKYLRTFRKAAHAILFTIYLRKFNEKIRINRDGYFSKFVYSNLKGKLFELKGYLVESSKPFFMLIIDKYSIDYRPIIKDDIRLQKQKINSLHKLVNYQINCLQKCIRQISDRDYLIEVIYYLCKHGNYSCLYNINTIEQLNSMCISQKNGYVRADKYLEQSSIVSLIFIKLLLFNILLQPQKIDLQISNNIDRGIIYNNIKLVGNILYQLFIDVQEDFQERSPQIYTVNNWISLKNRFNFKFATSMTVRERYFKNNQLISGLSSQKLIKQVYRTNQMIGPKNSISKLTNILHKGIVRYHQKMKKIISFN